MAELPTLTPSVPAPSSEVTVRTLASDLEAIKASGGSVISPAGTSAELTHREAHIVQGSNGHLLSTIMSWLAVFLAILALGAGAYIAYGYLTAPEAVPDASEPAPAAESTPQNTEGNLGSQEKTIPNHASLLARPAAHAGSFPLEAPGDTLKTHFQLIREGMERIPAAARAAELTPTDATGKPLSLAGFLQIIGAGDAISATTYQNFLQPDFSLLLVRGPGGFSPAYVLSLKPNTAWLYAEPGVRAMEGRAGTAKLSLQLQTPALGQFADEQIGGQSARSAPYGTGIFTYGFLKNRLVIATSRAALDEALLLLCLEPDSC